MQTDDSSLLEDVEIEISMESLHAIQVQEDAMCIMGDFLTGSLASMYDFGDDDVIVHDVLSSYDVGTHNDHHDPIDGMLIVDLFTYALASIQDDGVLFLMVPCRHGAWMIICHWHGDIIHTWFYVFIFFDLDWGAMFLEGPPCAFQHIGRKDMMFLMVSNDDVQDTNLACVGVMETIHGDVLEELIPEFHVVDCTSILSHDVVIYAILMELLLAYFAMFFGDEFYASSGYVIGGMPCLPYMVNVAATRGSTSTYVPDVGASCKFLCVTPCYWSVDIIIHAWFYIFILYNIA